MASNSICYNRGADVIHRQFFTRRQLRGLGILARGNQIVQIDSSTYQVRSQRSASTYTVAISNRRWSCKCADFLKGGKWCKHIFAVQFWIKLPDMARMNGYEIA